MKLIILHVFFIICSIATFSQSTYNISNYGNAGYSLKFSSIRTNLSGIDFSQTGSNFIWDYATLGKDVNEPLSILDPSSTGYKNPFILKCTFNTGNIFACNNKWDDLTDIARLDLDSLATPIITIYDVTSLMSISINVMVTNIQGAKVADSNNIIVPITSEFIDKDTVYKFPLNYLNSHTSNGKWEVDLSPVGQPIKLGISYTRNYTVEGWGNLITPYKTHNDVLKVKTIINEIDSLTLSGNSFGIPRTTVRYSWFDNNYGMPVMEAVGQIDFLNNEVITVVRYLDSSTISGIDENEMLSLSLYPNPTKKMLQINSNVTFNKVIVYNKLGEIIKEAKSTNNKIDVSFLNSGTYILGVFKDDIIFGYRKFIKN